LALEIKHTDDGGIIASRSYYDPKDRFDAIISTKLCIRFIRELRNQD